MQASSGEFAGDAGGHKPLIYADSCTPMNLAEPLAALSHGRGHEFESRRVHFPIYLLVGETRVGEEDEQRHSPCLMPQPERPASGYCRYDGRMSQESRDQLHDPPDYAA